jgi:hypothetical protein
MNKLPVLSYAMKNPPKRCPVRGFPMALRDMTWEGVERYDVMVSVADLAALPVNDRLLVAKWLNEVLMPSLNTYAWVTLSKAEEKLNETEGDSSFG